MPTLDEVKEQIKTLNASVPRGVVNALPDILSEDEVLEKIVRGRYSGEEKVGILCATNKRCIFVAKGILYGLRVEGISYAKIISVGYKTSSSRGILSIYGPGYHLEIDHIWESTIKDFGDYVWDKIQG